MAIVWNPIAGSAPRAPEGSITSALQQISNAGSALSDIPIKEAQGNLFTSQLASADQTRRLQQAEADKVISDRDTLLQNQKLAGDYERKVLNPFDRLESQPIQSMLSKTPEFRDMTPEQRLEIARSYGKSIPAGTNIADARTAVNSYRTYAKTLGVDDDTADAMTDRFLRTNFPTSSFDEAKELLQGIGTGGRGSRGSSRNKSDGDGSQKIIDYMLNNFSGDNELFRSDYIGNKFNKGDYAKTIAALRVNGVNNNNTIQNVLSGAVDPNGIGNLDFTKNEGFEELLARARLDPNHANQQQDGDYNSLEEILAARMGILNLTKPTGKSDADVIKDILAFYSGSAGGRGVPTPNPIAAALGGTPVPRTPELLAQPTPEQIAAPNEFLPGFEGGLIPALKSGNLFGNGQSTDLNRSPYQNSSKAHAVPSRKETGIAGVVKAIKDSTGFSNQDLQNLLKNPPSLEGASKAVDRSERSLLNFLQDTQDTIKNPGETIRNLLTPSAVPTIIPEEHRGRVQRGGQVPERDLLQEEVSNPDVDPLTGKPTAIPAINPLSFRGRTNTPPFLARAGASISDFLIPQATAGDTLWSAAASSPKAPIVQLAKSIEKAETGSLKNKFIRTFEPETPEGSTAYGSHQVTLGLVRDLKDRYSSVFTNAEMQYLNKLVAQGEKFARYGNRPDKAGYHPRYDYGGEGDLSGKADQEMYRQIIPKMLQAVATDIQRSNGGKPATALQIAEAWRGKSRSRDRGYFERLGLGDNV